MVRRVKDIFIDVRDACILLILTIGIINITMLILWALILASVITATELYRIAQ